MGIGHGGEIGISVHFANICKRERVEKIHREDKQCTEEDDVRGMTQLLCCHPREEDWPQNNHGN
jgi:hypothetical protein